MDIKYLSFLNPYKDMLGYTKGVDVHTIQQIETDFNVKLPKAYKEFLFVYGEESGNLLNSYLVEVHKLIGNRKSATIASVDELVGKKVELKDSFFFFAQWQGYVFYFFDCEEMDDDPKVYLLTDSPKIENYKESFTSFIRDEGLKPLLNLKNL